MARTGSSPSTSRIDSRRASLFKRHSAHLADVRGLSGYGRGVSDTILQICFPQMISPGVVALDAVGRGVVAVVRRLIVRG